MSYDHPTEVSDLDVAFGISLDGLLPNIDEIPDEFHRHTNVWAEVVQGLFSFGGTLPKTRDGIDRQAARRHLQAVLGSFDPSHEHKIAGAAYLLSLWCEPENEPAVKR